MPAHLSRHYRFALAALLALAATCALLLSPAGALAAEKGIQTDLGWGTTAQEQEQTVVALEETGVPWIRLDISWRQMEPTRGTYDADALALTDRNVQQAEQIGAGIIVAVSESPTWASGSAELNAPPLDVQDFADFTRDMAARYAGRVAAWEIWNEPNHPRFWKPAPNAGEYARLLQAAAPAVREGDPSAKVMFAGLAYNDHEYLEQVYAAAPNIGDSFDLMATHPYTAHGQSPADVDRGPDGRITKTSFLGFEEVRKVMLAHGDDRPIWLTEFGWSTNSQTDHPLGGVTEAQQAEYLALAFKMLEAVPYVPVAVVYNFRNNYWGGDADNWEDQLGLLRTDFSPKAAFAVFRDYQPPTGDESTPDPAEQPTQPTQPTDDPSSVAPSASALPVAAPQAPVSFSAGATRAPVITFAVRRMASSKALIARAGGQRVSLRVVGRLKAKGAGRVRLVVDRRVGGIWRSSRSIVVRVRNSTFTRDLSVRGGESTRIRAIYSPAGGDAVHAKPVTVRG